MKNEIREWYSQFCTNHDIGGVSVDLPDIEAIWEERQKTIEIANLRGFLNGMMDGQADPSSWQRMYNEAKAQLQALEQERK